MATQIRVTEPDEYRAVSRVMEIAQLQNVCDDDNWPKRATSWAESRPWSAWDGGECVGHASYYRSETSVVGGERVSAGLVTRVGVLPAARRRGAGSGLMNQVTRDGAEALLVLMSLHASEAEAEAVQAENS